jgi:hypothetical protein
MRFRLLRIWAVTVAVAGCASTQGASSDPEKQLNTALTALDRGDYRSATEALTRIVKEHPGTTTGQRALLALASVMLDPRNPNRRVDTGAGLAAQYLRDAKVPGWTEPLAQTMYLTALELGATDSARAVAETDAQQARAEAERVKTEVMRGRPLPRLPGQSVTSRIRDIQQDRDKAASEREKLSTRVQTLEQQLEAHGKMLADSVAELNRIRKTLRS